MALPVSVHGPLDVRLVVSDPSGRTDTTATRVIIGAPALDRFDRADGTPGTSWAGMTSAFAVRGHQLLQTGPTGYLTWNREAFGPEQEAWVEFDSMNTTAPEHDLLLCVRGPSWSAGAVQVTYAALTAQLTLNTYSPGVGWTRRGGPWRISAFGAGDRMGAVAHADGRVEIFRNGMKQAEGSVAGWSATGSGGRIGILLSGATRTRITRFGGGTCPDPVTLSAGTVAPHGPGRVTELDAARPLMPRVSPAIPNPVTREAEFELELPRPARVTLVVFDLAGRRVWSTPEAGIGAGRSALRWPGTDLTGLRAPTGVYLARITVDDARYLRRLTLMR